MIAPLARCWPNDARLGTQSRLHHHAGTRSQGTSIARGTSRRSRLVISAELGVSPTTQLVGLRLLVTPSVKGFGRRPFATVGLGPGPAPESLPRRKPRGGLGAVFRARLWGFEDRGGLANEATAAGSAGCSRRNRRRRRFSTVLMWASEAMALVEGGLATSCGRRARVPARGRRRKGSRVCGGMRGDGHEVSILMRLGEGERQGRGVRNVSTMSIRPPQHGQRRAGETSSA